MTKSPTDVSSITLMTMSPSCGSIDAELLRLSNLAGAHQESGAEQTNDNEDLQELTPDKVLATRIFLVDPLIDLLLNLSVCDDARALEHRIQRQVKVRGASVKKRLFRI